MDQKQNNNDGEKVRRTVRRSAEFKSKLNEASCLLAAKMEEKRRTWDTK